jgi:hypothetical protein
MLYLRSAKRAPRSVLREFLKSEAIMTNRIVTATPLILGIAIAGPMLASLGNAQSAAPLAFNVASVRQSTRYSWVRRPWTPNVDCAPIVLDQARRMLQARDLRVYALVVGKNGPKLKPRQENCSMRGMVVRDGAGSGGKEGNKCGSGVDLGFIQWWAFIREMLSGRADRPVIDKTGFEAQRAGRGGHPQNQTAIPDPDSTRASAFTAVEEKWGLKLEPQKAPVDVLAIDRAPQPPHVERPSGN